MKDLIFYFLIVITLLSCDKKEEKNPYLDIKISEEIPEIPYKQLKYKIKLPDTVRVNSVYKAIIEFESDFDTIMPPVQVDASDSTKVRLITFYHYEPIKSPMRSEEDLILKDSAFVLNKSFNVLNIVFNEIGEFVFCGLIYDEIMFNYYNKHGIRDSIYFARRKQQIFKKVVVIE